MVLLGVHLSLIIRPNIYKLFVRNRPSITAVVYVVSRYVQDFGLAM